MANIDGYLDTIANEPKGRLVKEAIYEALKAINAQAEIRPPAKREVPIGQMICDTGFLTYWEIGDMSIGELGFSSDIRKSTTHQTYRNMATSNTIFAGASGRMFVVIVYDYDGSIGPYVSVDSGSPVSGFERLGSYSLNLHTKSGLGADPPVEVSPITTKGVVHAVDDLPGNASDGDAYIFPEEEKDCIYLDHAWYTYDFTFCALDYSKAKQVDVYTGVVTGPGGLSVSASFSEGPLTLGVFVAYDKSDETVSEMPVRVCLTDEQYGDFEVKAYDETLTYKGSVDSVAELQNVTGETGDTYYVTNVLSSIEGGFYNWDGSRWVRDGTMYLSARDYIDRRENGTSEGTYKFYICVSLDPVGNYTSHMSPSGSDSGIVKSVCATGDQCELSAWLQKSTASRKYPFDYMKGSEYYRWAANGSMAIIPLEIGERSNQNGNSSD